MKKRTLCSAALLALVSTAVLAPVSAAAEAVAGPVAGPVNAEGTGSITYEQGNDQPPVTPPGEDGPNIIGPEKPGTWSPLMVIGASSLDFETQKIGQFTEAQEYYAAPFTTNEELESGEVGPAITMENFVKFRDIRGVKSHDFTLSAQLTKQFTAYNKETKTYDEELVLKGAKLDYSNATLVTTQANQENLPVVGSENTTLKSSFTLAPNADTGVANPLEVGNSTPVLTNRGDQGFGVFDIKFGELEPAAGEESKDAARSIKLTVPNSNKLTESTYQAVITWTISEVFTPGMNADA
ncbi:hypothetical protein IGI37_003342 [Enterococcus sp. AZ194]|uniref:WxL domain-containing protein n=1 Tax=Enterococcus sp. AZ194 TaxID=2774629 RepID=UPI003F1E7985